MHRTNIYLDDRQIGLLDRIAADEGVSRAELIRRFIDRVLAGADDTIERDLAVIDASFGALAHVEYGERDPGDREEHLAQMWRRRA